MITVNSCQHRKSNNLSKIPKFVKEDVKKLTLLTHLSKKKLTYFSHYLAVEKFDIL